TDHSPAPAALKRIQDGNFIEAWGGIASLQVGFAVVATAAAARAIPLDRVARWMASGPARLAGLDGRKGGLAPGADADLAIWDPDAERTVDPSMLHPRHPVTPYAGMKLRGQVRTTILRGEIVFNDGRLASRPGGRMIGARP